jgi:hypothetical protein
MGGDSLMTETTKQCSSCGQTKAATEFYHTGVTNDGLSPICKECQLKIARRDNKNRMYVNGKYIPKVHPLHKPGRYKTFEDAAFSSLEKYESSTEGQVYVIVNPNFPEWVKVGMAVDAADRLNGYQTSSPFRDFVLNYSWDVNDRRSAESEAHSELQKVYERRSEWFKCTPEQAQEVVSGIVGSYQ